MLFRRIYYMTIHVAHKARYAGFDYWYLASTIEVINRVDYDQFYLLIYCCKTIII